MNLESNVIYRQAMQQAHILQRLRLLSPADQVRVRQLAIETTLSWEEALSEVQWSVLSRRLPDPLYQPPRLILPRNQPPTGNRQSRRQRRAG